MRMKKKDAHKDTKGTKTRHITQKKKNTSNGHRKNETLQTTSEREARRHKQKGKRTREVAGPA